MERKKKRKGADERTREKKIEGEGQEIHGNKDYSYGASKDIIVRLKKKEERKRNYKSLFVTTSSR